ncbi:MAG: DMT family transporter [SAR324 cluster bacterium]|nr:DMT family transporter [SAR324 cluster bacterium]
MSANPTINTSMTFHEWGLLFALSILWGGSFFFNGVAVRELPTFTIVVGRVALASVALLLVMRVTGQQFPRNSRIWIAFGGMGMLNNVVPFSLIVWGQIQVASGVASILNAMTPLFTVVVAHFMTSDEKMNGSRLLGIVIGFLGVFTMIGTDMLAGISANFLAHIAILCAALSYAFAGIFGRRFKVMGVSPIITATGQVTASSLFLVPMVILVEQPWTMPMPSVAAFASLVGIAVFSTALAYILYFRILATAGATNLLLVTFLIPISAILLGIAFLDESLLPKHLVGMSLIGAGMAAVDGRPWKKLKALWATREL